MDRKQRTPNGSRLNYDRLEPKQLLATLTVDTVLDNPATDGLISLREAITAANTDAAFGDASAGSGRDEILFAPALTGQTIELAGSLLSITQGLTIDGLVTVDAAGASRLFSVNTSEKVELKNLTLSGGQEINGGAIAVTTGGWLRLESATFEDNESLVNGGAVFQAGGRLEIASSIFRNNSAKGGSGGAVYSRSRTLIDSTAFERNEATVEGGAIYMGAESLLLTDSSFTRNGFAGLEGHSPTDAVPVNGGAIFFNRETSGTLRNSSFEFNGAENGGAVAGVNFRLLSSDSTFDRNTAREDGGAFHVLGASANIKIEGTASTWTDVDFNSTLDGHGGAIHQENGSLTVSNIRFRYNESGSSGGAIFAGGFGSSLDLFVTGSAFYRNEAEDFAGGMYTYRADAKINDTSFSENSAADNGGAIYANNSELELIGRSRFTSNTARVGGGIATNFGAILEIRGTAATPVLFVANVSDFGGGINASRTTATIDYAEFVNNRGDSTLLGGGAALFDGGQVDIRNSFFLRNKAGRGGAVYRSGTAMNVTDTRFASNAATNSGGAIYQSSAIETIITGSSFYLNRADAAGGAIWNLSKMTVLDSFFYGNFTTDVQFRGAGGGAIYNGNDLLVRNSIFKNNNTTGSGGAIRNFRTLRSVDNYFFENEAGGAVEIINVGGAIYSSGNSQSVLNGSVFRANAARSGGAVAVTDGLLTGNGNRFGGLDAADGNIASPVSNVIAPAFRGGALYVSGDANVNLADSVFLNNVSAGDGGAVAVDSDAQSSVLLTGAVFQFNRANVLMARDGSEIINTPDRHRGGAVYVRTGKFESRDSWFADNVSGNAGAAVFNTEGSVVLRDVHATRNESDSSEATIFNDGEFLIVDSFVLNLISLAGDGLQETATASSNLVRTGIINLP